MKITKQMCVYTYIYIYICYRNINWNEDSPTSPTRRVRVLLLFFHSYILLLSCLICQTRMEGIWGGSRYAHNQIRLNPVSLTLWLTILTCCTYFTLFYLLMGFIPYARVHTTTHKYIQMHTNTNWYMELHTNTHEDMHANTYKYM